MPFDATGLAAMLSSVPQGMQQGAMGQQQLMAAQLQNKQRQQEMARQQVEDQANIAAGLGLIDETAQIFQPPTAGAPPNAPSMSGGGQGPTGASGPAITTPAGGAPSPAAATPRASSSGGLLDPYSVAARIKKANPDIKPDALFRATQATITMMGPMAQTQYRNDLLQLRGEMQMATLEQRIREADQRLSQGADKIQVQRETLALREQIAQLNAQSANQRQLDRLNASVDSLAAKAGVAPTGDRKKDLGAVADANAAKGADKKQAGGADAEYKLAATQRQAVNAKINDLLKENGGMLPSPGTPARAKYDTLVKQRDGYASTMTDARKKNPKLANWDAAKNSLDQEESAGELPDDLPDAKGLPDGAQAKDENGKVVAVVKGGAWAAPAQ